MCWVCSGKKQSWHILALCSGSFWSTGRSAQHHPPQGTQTEGATTLLSTTDHYSRGKESSGKSSTGNSVLQPGRDAPPFHSPHTPQDWARCLTQLRGDRVARRRKNQKYLEIAPVTTTFLSLQKKKEGEMKIEEKSPAYVPLPVTEKQTEAQRGQ